MSYKYLNEHPRARIIEGAREKKQENGSFRGNQVERIMYGNCIQEIEFHTYIYTHLDV